MNSLQNPTVDEPLLNPQKRRELAWQLRYERDWPLKRIAARLGVTGNAVDHLLRREAAIRSRLNAGPVQRPRRMKRTRIHPVSLSYTFNV